MRAVGPGPAPVGRTPDAGAAPAYCGHCGEPLSAPNDGDAMGHGVCDQRLELEPPRYCPACRRRMVVQVTPRGWTASCSRHGEMSS
ncbi:biotin synthase auxiliary protein BsaP [Kytococcus sp. Marseille-QA3725]